MRSSAFPAIPTNLFCQAARERGRPLTDRGAVQILGADEDFVEARVRDGGTYFVQVEILWDEIHVECGCPVHKIERKICPHIWAVIRSARERGLLREIERHRSLFVLSEGTGGKLGIDAISPPKKTWEAILMAIEGESTVLAAQDDLAPEPGEILYTIDLSGVSGREGVVLETARRVRKADGEWGRPKGTRIERRQIPHLGDPADRRILAALSGAEPEENHWYHDRGRASSRILLSAPLAEAVLPEIFATHRAWIRRPGARDETPLVWDDGAPWRFQMEVSPSGPEDWRIEGRLERPSERADLTDALVLSENFVILGDSAARLDHAGALAWLAHLRREGAVTVPRRNWNTFHLRLLSLPGEAPMILPEECRVERIRPAPRPHLRIRKAAGIHDRTRRLTGDLSYEYEDTKIEAHDPTPHLVRREPLRVIERDRTAEGKFLERLLNAGFRRARGYRGRGDYEIPVSRMPRAVAELTREGWRVEAEGKIFRRPGQFEIGVTSGIDWFDLHAKVDYDGVSVDLPRLLEAVRRKDGFVPLGDGSVGILPEEWLRKYAGLAGLGAVEKTPEGEALRFTRSQAGFLDALLAEMPEARTDEVFRRARAEMTSFTGIEARRPPEGFRGVLRDYQGVALGWFDFLRRFGFGGCLADDMGLGKTVMVLALLEERRRAGAKAPASLVVAPRSLVFNWIQEAARFAPSLRLLDHSSPARERETVDFAAYDLVLTTYGVLQRDILLFKDHRFDYLILDESQAVKNAATQRAKSVRLLAGDHRLALSGTPIENHIGELWSLFEFLNPGLLGGASAFAGLGAAAEGQNLTLVARALRPFFLRRTKEQVVRDLPAKTEKTIYCDLDETGRRHYDELRDHYRLTLSRKIEADGLARSKIHVLEALLRLRQAACHPGLVDKARVKESSAKIDVLMDRIEEVLEEGHKALVFSSFTSLLAIVRARLDHRKTTYEYLDGKTRDRAARVERFQNDAACRLFLVSLKAGGLGLNLTAADYVFLLDPWWNPAAEAQAVDRTHRIGQTRPVFAYRLIARDTVEEKVLELQGKKRDLAGAILTGENSLIRRLTKEDLEILMS